MYNPNNIVIGGAVLFIIAYAFFIIRRMYKRRINYLEEEIIELKKCVEEFTESAEYEKENYNLRNSVVLEIPKHFDVMSNTTNDVEDVTDSVPVKHSEFSPLDIDEPIVYLHESKNNNQEAVQVIESQEEIQLQEQEQEQESEQELDQQIIEVKEDTKDVESQEDSYEKVKLLKDDIDSMTIAQLKKTLTEYGKTFSNNMRKKELRELVISL